MSAVQYVKKPVVISAVQWTGENTAKDIFSYILKNQL